MKTTKNYPNNRIMLLVGILLLSSSIFAKASNVIKEQVLDNKKQSVNYIALNESVQPISESSVTSENSVNQTTDKNVSKSQAKQAIASDNMTDGKNKQEATAQISDNVIENLTKNIGNYLKDLQTKNVDYLSKNEISTFRLEVERFLISQSKDLLSSSF